MRLSPRLVPWLVALLTLVWSLGCSNDRGEGGKLPDLSSAGDERPADRVVATLLMTADEVTLVGLRPAKDHELPKPQAPAPLLGWSFEDASGQIVESGTITAPVVTLSEFDENGKPAPETTVAGAAMFDIELPNVGGTFVLFDPSAAGGTSPQSWGGFKKSLKLFIEKLIGIFKFKGGSGQGGSGGGTNVGGSSAGGAGAGGTAAGGSNAGGSNAGGSSTGGASAGGGGAGSGATGGVETGPTVQMVKPTTACVGMTLLVVSEGYTQAEASKFQADAEQIVGALSQHSGYKENWKDVAIYSKFFVSKDSGISDPAAGVVRDTAFRVQHDPVVHRSISSASDLSPAVAAQLAAVKGEVQADAVLYLANTSEWAGAAQPWNREGFGSAHPQAGLIMSHELAHALFDLADEYSDGTCNPESSFQGPNVALSLTAIPWSNMLTKGVALPTTGGDANTVGAYEGALYCTSGAYRPQHTCKMRDASVGFCKVCLAQIETRFKTRTAACNQGTCEHSECKAGGALAKGCSACTATVCAEKPECCDPEKGWTDECVKLAANTPGPCRGICYDGSSSCGHSECTSGDALPSSCSTCAGSVCQKDPFCCSGKWDAICTTEAERDPYCSCKTAQ